MVSRSLRGFYTLAPRWLSRARVPRAAARPGSSGGGGGPRAAVVVFSFCFLFGRPRCRGRNVFHLTCRPCPRRGIKYRQSVARLPVQARPRSTCISGRRRGCLCGRGRARPLLTRPRQCGQAPVAVGRVCGRRRGCLCRRGRARPASTVGGAAACAGEAALDPFSRGHDSAGRRPLSQGRCAMSGPGPAALPGCMQIVTRR